MYPSWINGPISIWIQRLILYLGLAYRDFAFRDFGTPVVRLNDIPNSRYLKSQYPKLSPTFGISALHILQFRDSRGEVFWHFNSRYLKLRNGVGSMDFGVLHFVIFTFLSWVASSTPPMLDLIFPCSYPCAADLPCMPVCHKINKHTLALFVHLCTISFELTLSLFFHCCILWSCHQWQAHLPVNMPT